MRKKDIPLPSGRISRRSGNRDHPLGAAGGKTSIKISYYHAIGADKSATSKYDLFETVVLAKQRRR